MTKILRKLSAEYGWYFIVWMIVIFIAYKVLYRHVELQSVIFSLIAISFILSVVCKKIILLIRRNKRI